MANALDVAVGAALASSGVLIFVAYTFWAVVLPFVPKESWLHGVLPPRKWALYLPMIALAGGVALIAAFIVGMTRKKAAKK